MYGAYYTIKTDSVSFEELYYNEDNLIEYSEPFQFNEQNNEYVKTLMAEYGYVNDVQAEK